MQGLINDTNVPLSAFYNLANPLNPIWDPGSTTARRTLRVRQAWQSTANDDSWGAQSELTWNLGLLKVTWLAAYRELRRNEAQQSLDLGLPTFLFPNAQAQQFWGHYWQHSQEIRFATTGDGPVNGQFGAYYFREESGVLDLLPNAFVPGNPLTGGVIPYYGFHQDPTSNEA